MKSADLLHPGFLPPSSRHIKTMDIQAITETDVSEAGASSATETRADAAAATPKQDAKSLQLAQSEPDPGSTTPVEPVPVIAPTPTQRAIQGILKTDSTSAPMDALSALVSLEARQLPLTIAVSELVPKDNPKICCFDLASFPSNWSIQAPCARCLGLNSLMQRKLGFSSCRGGAARRLILFISPHSACATAF